MTKRNVDAEVDALVSLRMSQIEAEKRMHDAHLWEMVDALTASSREVSDRYHGEIENLLRLGASL